MYQRLPYTRGEEEGEEDEEEEERDGRIGESVGRQMVKYEYVGGYDAVVIHQCGATVRACVCVSDVGGSLVWVGCVFV